MDTSDIQKLASLARLNVNESEEKSLLSDFSSILAFVEEIQKVAVDETVPLPTHKNIFREDSTPHEDGLYTEALLANAPKTKNGFLVVKKVIDHGR